MTSLHQHLMTPDQAGHSRLAFRRDCAQCRESRLAGSLPPPALLSPAAQATLAAGVIATATLLPSSAAIARAPLNIATTSSQKEAMTPPSNEPSSSQPGGHGVGLGKAGGDNGAGDQQQEATMPPAPSDSGGGPDHSSLGSASDQVSGSAPAAPAPQSRSSTSAAPDSPASAPSPAAWAARPHAAAPHATGGNDGRAIGAPQAARTSGGSSGAHSAPPSDHGTSQPARSAGQSGSHASASSPSSGTRGAAQAQTTRDRSPSPAAKSHSPKPHKAARGTHVVRAGESLWRIAAHHLGAGTSDAKIAALVDQLWTMNAKRIATGNPDLISPGQHLRIPG